MIRNYVNRLVGTYAYQDVSDFLFSLFPSFKYRIQNLSIGISMIAAGINEFIGIGPVLCSAMTLAIVVETITGIRASSIRGESFESFKFSRCVFKIAVWLSLVFFTHSFYRDCLDGTSWVDEVGEVFFYFVKFMILTYFLVEYITSILENLAVIDGKPKDTLVNAVKSQWSLFVDLLKNRNHGK